MPEEKDGVHGHFVNIERLTADIENGRLFHFEQDPATGHLSGISFQSMDDIMAAGQIPLVALPLESVRSQVNGALACNMHTNLL